MDRWQLIPAGGGIGMALRPCSALPGRPSASVWLYALSGAPCLRLVTGRVRSPVRHRVLGGVARPEAAELCNPAPGGEVQGSLGSSHEETAQVFYRVKDPQGDLDSPSVSVTATEE